MLDSIRQLFKNNNPAKIIFNGKDDLLWFDTALVWNFRITKQFCKSELVFYKLKRLFRCRVDLRKSISIPFLDTISLAMEREEMRFACVFLLVHIRSEGFGREKNKNLYARSFPIGLLARTKRSLIQFRVIAPSFARWVC